MSGRAAIQHLKYKRQTLDGTYEIDTERIRQICENYVSDEERAIIRVATDRQGNTTEWIEYKPISRQGLRRALDISRATYNYWLDGYVDSADKDDESVLSNDMLVRALRAGDDAIMQYLAEDSDKYMQTKQIRMLESYGELLPQKTVKEINAKVSLGKFDKYSN